MFMKVKKSVSLVLIGMMFMVNIPYVTATQSDTITIEDYLEQMVKMAKVKVDKKKEEPYVAAAIEYGFLTEKEYKSWKKPLTRVDAIVIGSRVEALVNGSSNNETMWKKIVERGRISDLNQIPKEKQDAVVEMFSKGIVVGSSNGRFSQSRKLEGFVPVTPQEAKIIQVRIKDKTKRKKLSPDGQVIRTEKLPKNYKDFEYILESFPNSIYEAPFKYKRTKYYKTPVELVDYTRPCRIREMMFAKEYQKLTMKEVLDAHLDTWCDLVKKNITYRFNVDYRTIDSKWVNGLRSTYYVWEDDPFENKKRTNGIKDYVKEVKKHKVIVTASNVVVEPSFVHYNNGIYLRAYVKFKVVSGDNVKASTVKGAVELSDTIYSTYTYVENYKQNVWLERYFDIGVGSINGYSTGNDYAVVDNWIIDMQMK